MCLLINIYGMSFRDNLLQYNHLCFGRDSGFLAVVRYVLFVFISKRRGRMEQILLTLQRLPKKVVFEANQPSEGKKGCELAHFKAQQITFNLLNKMGTISGRSLYVQIHCLILLMASF